MKGRNSGVLPVSITYWSSAAVPERMGGKYHGNVVHGREGATHREANPLVTGDCRGFWEPAALGEY